MRSTSSSHHCALIKLGQVKTIKNVRQCPVLFLCTAFGKGTSGGYYWYIFGVARRCIPAAFYLKNALPPAKKFLNGFIPSKEMSHDPSCDEKGGAMQELHCGLDPRQFAYLWSVLASCNKGPGETQTETSSYSAHPPAPLHKYPESSTSFDSEVTLGDPLLMIPAMRGGFRAEKKMRGDHPRKGNAVRNQSFLQNGGSLSSSDGCSVPLSGCSDGKDSMLALKGPSFSIDDPRVASNLRVAELQYEAVHMPLITFQGVPVTPASQTLKQSCNESPACKKTLQKYAFHKCLRLAQSQNYRTG